MIKPYKHLLLGLGAVLIIASCIAETPKETAYQSRDDFIKPVVHYNGTKPQPSGEAVEPIEAKKTINLVIPEGASGSEVAALLFEKGLIDNERDFKKRLMDLKLDRRIICGAYSIPEAEDMDSIIERITKGST
ncbi:MAG: endolytic transglycosylase MltG [Clostridiales bacterium]|nr:endolytic transglycosylase MltG [Clostridiales bacterium]